MNVGLAIAVFLGLAGIMFGIHHSLSGRLDSVMKDVGDMKTTLGEMVERTQRVQKTLDTVTDDLKVAQTDLTLLKTLRGDMEA